MLTPTITEINRAGSQPLAQTYFGSSTPPAKVWDLSDAPLGTFSQWSGPGQSASSSLH